MKKIIITLNSVTMALKAKKLLEAHGIATRLLKMDTVRISEGCTHGLEIDYKSFIDAVSILKNRNITYKVDSRSENDLP